MLDTITLHVLSPSPEVRGGRLTFPSISLDTTLSHLKSRIQRSHINPPPSPEEQRLIYRGRPLLNMDMTLRQLLHPELNAITTDRNLSCTVHLVITHPPGSTPIAPAGTSQNQASRQRSTPTYASGHPATGQAQITLPDDPPGTRPITAEADRAASTAGQRNGINGTLAQTSRQPTPVPGTSALEAPSAPRHQPQATSTTGFQPQAPSANARPSRLLRWSPNGYQYDDEPPTPHLRPPGYRDHEHHHLSSAPNQLSQPPPVLPSNTNSDVYPRASPTATTAYLLSSPAGPQALVLSPGHGSFLAHIPSPHNTVTSAAPIRHFGTQSLPKTPARPTIDPVNANANTQGGVQHQRAHEAVIRARNVVAAAAARQNPAVARNANNANNDVLRVILARGWTFIKLYFVIFMFTESGTWSRWIWLLIAVLVSAMPSTDVFRAFAVRLQAMIDGLVPTPAPRLPAPPPPQRGVGPSGGGGRTEAPAADNNNGETRPGELDATTAATLTGARGGLRQRRPNTLRDTLEPVERAVGFFIASLVPGVSERHVRAREEARREAERLAAAAAADALRRLAGGVGGEDGGKNENSAESAEAAIEQQTGSSQSQSGSGGSGSGVQTGEQRQQQAQESAIGEQPLVEI